MPIPETGRRESLCLYAFPAEVARTVFAALCLFVPWAASEVPQVDRAQAPNFEARKHQTEYNGPGREEREPIDLPEVRIGYFGPAEPSHPSGGSVWEGLQLGIEQANREGGYRGLPFRLIPVWAADPWSTGVGRLAGAVYHDGVWAIIGGIDGPSTHLAEQIVVKARLTLISPVSSDKTANLANVPWIFSVAPGDHEVAPVIGAAVADSAGCAPFALISAAEHDSHALASEVRRQLHTRKAEPLCHVEFASGTADPHLVGHVLTQQPKIAVLIAGVADSARMLIALREGGFTGAVIGGPAMGRRAFLAAAGKAAEGVLFPMLDEPSAGAEEFTVAFQRRTGYAPDYAAAQAYDSVCLLVTAIRRAGMNRARIGDAVRELSPWRGVSGIIRWDPLGQNTRTVRLGTIREGRVEPGTALKRSGRLEEQSGAPRGLR